MKHLFTQHGTEVRVDGVPMASCIDPQSAHAVREALDRLHNDPFETATPLPLMERLALVAGAVAMLALAGLGAVTLAAMLIGASPHV